MSEVETPPPHDLDKPHGLVSSTNNNNNKYREDNIGKYQLLPHGSIMIFSLQIFLKNEQVLQVIYLKGPPPPPL